MSFWFSKKKVTGGSGESQLKALVGQLEQQRKDNTALRIQLEDLKESALRNKMMLDEFISNASNYDKATEQMKLKIQGMENTLRTYETTAKQLKYLAIRDENETLKAQLKNPVIQTDFLVGGGQGPSIQDILDASESQNELIFFKDANSAVWQILKRDESDLPVAEERRSSENDDSIVDPEALENGGTIATEDLPLP